MDEYISALSAQATPSMKRDFKPRKSLTQLRLREFPPPIHEVIASLRRLWVTRRPSMPWQLQLQTLVNTNPYISHSASQQKSGQSVPVLAPAPATKTLTCPTQINLTQIQSPISPTTIARQSSPIQLLPSPAIPATNAKNYQSASLFRKRNVNYTRWACSLDSIKCDLTVPKLHLAIDRGHCSLLTSEIREIVKYKENKIQT